VIGAVLRYVLLLLPLPLLLYGGCCWVLLLGSGHGSIVISVRGEEGFAKIVRHTTASNGGPDV
jgi:hypothetical protein